ncbi:hypothetical protein NPIL_489241 [Nephila pilipes]|uniref:Uncharacterized protein n=1 Tax=Nephila pilipes TaxID=299642 RepID=A0A8X6TCH2_NEPPI|nr:hypothetical protein NPIL_489241 [Nephila pilipes]
MTHLQLSRCSETQDQCWRCPEGPVHRQNGGLFVQATTTWVRISQPLGSCSNFEGAESLITPTSSTISCTVKRRSTITKFRTLSTLAAPREVWGLPQHSPSPSPLMCSHL